MADKAPPSAVSFIVATAVLAGISGYMIGIASSLGFLPIPFAPKSFSTNPPQKRSRTAGYDNEEESSEEEVGDDEVGGGLDHAPDWGQGAPTKSKAKKEEKQPQDNGEECKLVLVVRTDLGMTKGKIAAQASHATLACYKSLSRSASKSPLSASILRRWERLGQAKIAVQVKSEEELLTLQATALSLGVTAEVIADAGRTQIASGSLTVLGVGPAPKSLVDNITGGLKLL